MPGMDRNGWGVESYSMTSGLWNTQNNGIIKERIPSKVGALGSYVCNGRTGGRERAGVGVAGKRIPAMFNTE